MYIYRSVIVEQIEARKSLREKAYQDLRKEQEENLKKIKDNEEGIISIKFISINSYSKCTIIMI